jgi:hypothetical protein
MFADFCFYKCGKDMGSFDVEKNGEVRSQNKIDSPCTLWAEFLPIPENLTQTEMLANMEIRPYYSDRFVRAVRTFGFNEREIDKLHAIFEQIDFNGGGSIDVDELFKFLVS